LWKTQLQTRTLNSLIEFSMDIALVTINNGFRKNLEGIGRCLLYYLSICLSALRTRQISSTAIDLHFIMEPLWNWRTNIMKKYILENWAGCFTAGLINNVLFVLSNTNFPIEKYLSIYIFTVNCRKLGAIAFHSQEVAGQVFLHFFLSFCCTSLNSICLAKYETSRRYPPESPSPGVLTYFSSSTTRNSAVAIVTGCWLNDQGVEFESR
jgi:hypothetical protein